MTNPHAARRRSIHSVVAMAALLGCEGPTDPPVRPDPPDPSANELTVAVSVPDDTIRVGFPMTVSATVTDEEGQPVAARVWWNSSDLSVLHVDPSGYADPRSAGDAWLIGGVDAVADSVLVHVLRPILELRIELHNGPFATPFPLVVGQTLQLFARAYLTNGDPYPYDGPLTWVSTDSAVAAVDGTGLVRALAPGSASILLYGEAAVPDVATFNVSAASAPRR